MKSHMSVSELKLSDEIEVLNGYLCLTVLRRYAVEYIKIKLQYKSSHLNVTTGN